MREEFEQLFGIHEALLFEFENIVHVSLMTAVQLGEDLAVKIKMSEIHLSNPSDERAPLPPTGHFGNEKIRTRQLDIRIERVLQLRDRLEESPEVQARP